MEESLRAIFEEQKRGLQQQQLFEQQFDNLRKKDKGPHIGVKSNMPTQLEAPIKSKKTRSYALISSDEIFEKWEKGLCELCDELYVPGHKCKKVSSDYVIIVVDEEEDLRQPDFGVENPPSMDASQVFDESPMRNTHIKPDEWMGEGQGKVLEDPEVVSYEPLGVSDIRLEQANPEHLGKSSSKSRLGMVLDDDVDNDSGMGNSGSYNAIGKRVDGLNPSNDLFEKSISNIHYKDSDLCEQEQSSEDVHSEMCVDEELLVPIKKLKAFAMGLKAVCGKQKAAITTGNDTFIEENDLASEEFGDLTGNLLLRAWTRDIIQRVKMKGQWQGGVCLVVIREVLCWLYGTFKEYEAFMYARLMEILATFKVSVVRFVFDPGDIPEESTALNVEKTHPQEIATEADLDEDSKDVEESWSLMIQKIVISLSSLLNEALEGLEEDSVRDEASALLVQPGKDPPPSLGGQMVSEELVNKGARSQLLLLSTISSLMNCCCIMLTSYYPVQPFPTAMQQEFVCAQLPALQLCSLEVLAAVVKGRHCQLLPHAADIILMGARTALYISQEVISNGLMDLRLAGPRSDGAFVEELPIEATLQHQPNERKGGTVIVPPVAQHASFGYGVKASKDSLTSITLKIAAGEALEALAHEENATSEEVNEDTNKKRPLSIVFNKCKVYAPQLANITKHLAIHYDFKEQNALIQNKEKNETYKGLLARNFLVHYYLKEQNALVRGSLSLGSKLQLGAAYDGKAYQGELTMVVNLSVEDNTFEMASVLLSIGLPKATLKFPYGQVSLEEKENDEVQVLFQIGREQFRERWADKFDYVGSTPSLCAGNDLNEPSVLTGPEVTMPKDALQPWVVFDPGGMIFLLTWLLLHTIHNLEAPSAVFDPGGNLVSRYSACY